MFTPQEESAAKRVNTENSPYEPAGHSNIDSKLTDMLVKENRQLKQLLESSREDMQALEEKAQTLQLLESECQEENEVLKYKVMSMDAELKEHKGKSLQDLQIVDQLHTQNKELSRQVALLKRELQLAH